MQCDLFSHKRLGYGLGCIFKEVKLYAFSKPKQSTGIGKCYVCTLCSYARIFMYRSINRSNDQSIKKSINVLEGVSIEYDDVMFMYLLP